MDVLLTALHDPLIIAALFTAAMFAGFVDTVVGGGGLILIPALMLALPATPPTVTLATNKFAAFFGTFSAAISYQKQLPSPRKQLAMLCTPAALCSAFGACAAMQINPAILRPIILVAITAVGIFLIVRHEFGHEQARDRRGHPHLHQTLRAAAILLIHAIQKIHEIHVIPTIPTIPTPSSPVNLSTPGITQSRHHTSAAPGALRSGDPAWAPQLQPQVNTPSLAKEALRCMGCGSCIGCDNCYGLCPDNAIAKISTGHYAVKTDYCKGCGICVQECPSGAMAIAAVHR